MIGKLKGTIDSVFENAIILMTSSGVGYLVSVADDLVNKNKTGEEVSIFIQTIVKEDDIILCGFELYEQLVWFNSLLKVSGVGVRVAMSVMNAIPLDQIISAISSKNHEVFKVVSGLGEKIAQRIVNELKNEQKKNSKLLSTLGISIAVQDIASNKINDVTEALEKLGFQRGQVSTCVSKIMFQNNDLSETDIITMALKELSLLKSK